MSTLRDPLSLTLVLYVVIHVFLHVKAHGIIHGTYSLSDLKNKCLQFIIEDHFSTHQSSKPTPLESQAVILLIQASLPKELLQLKFS